MPFATCRTFVQGPIVPVWLRIPGKLSTPPFNSPVWTHNRGMHLPDPPDQNPDADTDTDTDTTPSAESGSIGRFLTLADTAEILNISASQAYALVRSGELPAIKIGGRGQWRIERSVLESYIAAKYEETRRMGLWNQSDYASLTEHSFDADRRGPADQSRTSRS